MTRLVAALLGAFAASAAPAPLPWFSGWDRPNDRLRDRAFEPVFDRFKLSRPAK